MNDRLSRERRRDAGLIVAGALLLLVVTGLLPARVEMPALRPTIGPSFGSELSLISATAKKVEQVVPKLNLTSVLLDVRYLFTITVGRCRLGDMEIGPLTEERLTQTIEKPLWE